MLLFLAFSLALAQPRLYSAGPYGPAIGSGTPGPYPVAFAPVVPTQNQFDYYAANEDIRVARTNAKANNVVYNVAASTIFPGTTLSTDSQSVLTRFGASTKAAANYISEELIQDRIAYFRATHRGPLKEEDRYKLDDLYLQLESARNQKTRRIAAALPADLNKFSNGAKISSFFDRRGREASVTLAANKLDDARKDYNKDPSDKTRTALVNARDTLELNEDKRNANTLDLLGTFGGANGAVAGPMLRKRATGSAVEIAERNYRISRLKYTQDPTPDNLDDLRLNDLSLRIADIDNDETGKDLLVASLTAQSATGLGATLNMWSKIGAGVGNQEMARLQLRQARLKRQILEKKIQKAAAEDKKKKESSSKDSSSSAKDSSTTSDAAVGQRLMAMSIYGRQPLYRPTPF